MQLDKPLRTDMKISFMMVRGHVAGRRSEVGTINLLMEDQGKSPQQKVQRKSLGKTTRNRDTNADDG